MVNVKELKSIDLASYTTILTAISVLFAVITSIAIAIGIMIITPDLIGISIYIIPTIIVGTFMIGIYRYFTDGLLYNLLSKKLKNIKIALNGGEVVKVSPTETATMVATISTIQVVLVYLVSVFILPLILSTLIQTLIMYNQMLAYSIYQLMMLLSQPTTIIMFIFGTFVITFIFTLIGVYVYNFLASKGRGIALELSEENGMTAADSIDMMKFATVVAIIGGVLSLITGIVSLISGGSIISLVGGVISSLIGGFIMGALTAIFYNFLATKLGKLKIELID